MVWRTIALWLVSTNLMAMSLSPSNDDLTQFTHFNEEAGLNQASVTAIAQDNHGFLWVGTQAGLSRFDGHQFRQIIPLKDEPQIQASWVKHLKYDNNTLWAGTNIGLLKVNLSDQSIERAKLSEEEIENIHGLYLHHGILWVAVENQLYKSETKAKEKFAPVRKFKSSKQIRGVEVSTYGTWVLTDTGLWLLTENKTTEVPIPDELKEAALSKIIIHDNKLILATESDGVWYKPLEKTTDDVVKKKFVLLGFKDIKAVQALIIDNQYRLWMGGENGIAVVDWHKKTYSRTVAEPNTPQKLQSNSVISLLKGKKSIWLGTHGTGLAQAREAPRIFNVINDDQKRTPHLPNATIYSLATDKSGNTWIGSQDGIAYYNQASQTIETYRTTEKDNHYFPAKLATSILVDREGFIWASAWKHGLTRIQPNRSAINYWQPTTNNTGPKGSKFACIREHPTLDRIYLCSRTVGIEWVDKKTLEFTHLSRGDTTPYKYASNELQDILFDHQKRIWVATLDAGVSMLDERSGESQHFRHIEGDPTGLQSNIVLDIHQTDENTIWVSTWNGLSRISLDDFSIKTYTKSDGLPDNIIYKVVHDPDGFLWITTNFGLSRFDPKLEQFTNFTENDGFPANEFNAEALHLDQFGTLWMGTIKGVVYFDPKTVKGQPKPNRVTLTELSIFNEYTAPRTPDGPLANSLHNSKALVFNHQQQMFSIQFASLAEQIPKRIHYQYRLIGLSNKWINTDYKNRIATYTNLDPGNYIFQVRSHNGDLKWNDPIQLPINITPAPWLSFWAIFAYFSVVLVFLMWFIRDRVRKNIEKQKAQRKIEHSQHQLANALWGSGDELWDWDIKNNHIERQNQSSLLGFENGRWSGLDDSVDRVHPDDFERIKEKINRHLQGLDSEYEATYRVKGTDGAWHWILDKGRITERDCSNTPIQMTGTIKNIGHLKAIEQELRDLNQSLEERVEKRTVALAESNKHLEQSINDLKNTQDQLVEAEKMASLGGMVAGVAHEINTPLGTCLTSVSFLKQELDKLYELESSGKLTKTAFLENKELVSSSVDIITHNIVRAAELIRSFKNVAVEQTQEDVGKFFLHDMLNDCVVATRPDWEKGHKVNIVSGKAIELESYQGLLSQVFINLIINSVKHGFKDKDQCAITIKTDIDENGWVEVNYIDTGKGLSPEVQEKIFEPFFTTERTKGSTGLGMHIIYNIIHQKLKGSISMEGDQTNGVHFRIRFPASGA